jgi:hypothetical protein
LKGRKKELIKTSYGKYVEPAKVESLLREIPGVEEAMLVGEGRPFCVALLWIQANALDVEAGQRIDHMIGQINQGLSHPEQVKRWAVLRNDLSIESGDQTANLKLKRQAIARRLDNILEELYAGTSPSQAVPLLEKQGRVKLNLLLKLLPTNLPVLIRQEILSELFQATAGAFKCPVPAFDHLSHEDLLKSYALFTREQAGYALHFGRDLRALKTQLYRNAYPLGAKLREWFGIDTMDEVMELGKILYQAIGIEIEGDPQGNVTVNRCYFSQFYPSPVCDLISALDDGVFSGLSGGGRLVFSQRLTEGAERGIPRQCCRARLSSRAEGIR